MKTIDLREFQKQIGCTSFGNNNATHLIELPATTVDNIIDNIIDELNPMHITWRCTCGNNKVVNQLLLDTNNINIDAIDAIMKKYEIEYEIMQLINTEIQAVCNC